MLFNYSRTCWMVDVKPKKVHQIGSALLSHTTLQSTTTGAGRERKAAVVAKLRAKEQIVEAREAVKRALDVKNDGKQCQATPNNTHCTATFKSGRQWMATKNGLKA